MNVRTLTDEEKLEIENKSKYITEKKTLLNKYKALAVDLEYAADDIEEDAVKRQREKLARKIKALSNLLRDIESMEHLA